MPQVLPQQPEVIENSQNVLKTELTPTEKRVLSAMLVADNIRELIELARVSKATYYKLKPKLELFRENIKTELKAKTDDILTGAIVDASKVFVTGLHAPSFDSRFKSAKEILDRVLGKPVERTDVFENKKVTILSVTATTEELEALKKPLTVLETDKQSPPKPFRENLQGEPLEAPVITGEVVEIDQV